MGDNKSKHRKVWKVTDPQIYIKGLLWGGEGREEARDNYMLVT